MARSLDPTGRSTFDNMFAAFLLQHIRGYGCWCYFDDQVGLGRSHPTDSIDEMCRILQYGYECVAMDHENCVPQDTYYDPLPSFDNIESNCQSVNGGHGQCAVDACIVETTFVKNYFLEVGLTAASVDESKQHQNGFSVDTNCPTKQGSVSERACCGSFPNRFPYSTLNDQRKCCGSTTYDSEINQCCEEAGDYVIRFICGL